MDARVAVIALGLGWLVACRPVSESWPSPSTFDATNAYRHVVEQVALGPRPSGSEAARRTADYIAAELRAAGLSVEVQEFHAGTPRGPMAFRNVIGRTRSGRGPVLLVGSHYDTKWLPQIHFVGANDSASSTGVALELARVLRRQPNLWFVFFDGEEAIYDYGPQDGLWGSRFFVEQLKATGRVRAIQALVLLDMVGDADLSVTLARNNTPALLEQVFRAADTLGYRRYVMHVPYEILDDHVPFLVAGIPAVNLIDFQFGSAPGRNDYWHTEHDTLDKLSVRSLEIVGQITVQLLGQLRTTARGR